MTSLIELLVLMGCLLAIVAWIQVLASRTGMPEATLLSLVGIALGASYVALDSVAPDFAHYFVAPLVDPSWPAEAYIWVFLPPLLFQVALTVDIRAMLQDAAPILLLAVVAVFVATGFIGLTLSWFSGRGILICLLIGAVVATTDPSAVVGMFREVGAPGRLIRLVEGESLLNDAAAIALVGVLTAMLTGAHTAEASWSGGLRSLAYAFGGGVLLGVAIGRLVAFLLTLMDNHAMAETALTLAVPYPLFMLGNQIFDVSGVVAVVCAALVINGLGTTRLARENWRHLERVWAQVAMVAGAIVFLLAAVRVPRMLHGADFGDGLFILAAVAAALAARLAVLFLMLPMLSRLQLAEPISADYRLAIGWGGLRGAVTLVLAMGIAENPSLPLETRHFIAIVATGFVLFSLLVNGSTLRWVVRALALDKLTPQEQTLQQQAIELSTQEVEQTLRAMATTFRIPAAVTDEVSAAYRLEMALGTATLDIDTALPERERFLVGLLALSMREEELIPDYGSGIVSVRNLDLMKHNAGLMIDASRREGRIGYNRAAKRILRPGPRYAVGLWLHRHLHWSRPLASALADRYELLICRRAVLERLRSYNFARLEPLLGERIAEILDGVLVSRIEYLDEALAADRLQFGPFTQAMERRLLMLFALRKGRKSLEAMVAEQVISKEVFNWIDQELSLAWRRALKRPVLREPGKAPAPNAPSTATAPTSAPMSASAESRK